MLEMNRRSKLKSLLVGTRTGDVLQTLRDGWDLIHTSKRHFEEAGNMANDILCRRLMLGIARPDTVFLDIGAHIGSITAGVLMRSPKTHIIAFEPIPEKAAQIRSRFPGIIVHTSAVGDHAGELTFYVSHGQSSCSSLDEHSASNGGEVEAITVQSLRLDDLDIDGPVDIIKIDVEGAEQGVVLGGQNLITHHRPIIFFESGGFDIPELGFSKDGLWHLFELLDYVVLLPTRLAHADEGMTLDVYLDSHLFPRRTNNYIAVPKERRQEMRDRANAFLGFDD